MYLTLKELFRTTPLPALESLLVRTRKDLKQTESRLYELCLAKHESMLQQARRLRRLEREVGRANRTLVELEAVRKRTDHLLKSRPDSTLVVSDLDLFPSASAFPSPSASVLSPPPFTVDLCWTLLSHNRILSSTLAFLYFSSQTHHEPDQEPGEQKFKTEHLSLFRRRLLRRLRELLCSCVCSDCDDSELFFLRLVVCFGLLNQKTTKEKGIELSSNPNPNPESESESESSEEEEDPFCLTLLLEIFTDRLREISASRSLSSSSCLPRLFNFLFRVSRRILTSPILTSPPPHTAIQVLSSETSHITNISDQSSSTSSSSSDSSSSSIPKSNSNVPNPNPNPNPVLHLLFADFVEMLSSSEYSKFDRIEVILERLWDEQKREFARIRLERWINEQILWIEKTVCSSWVRGCEVIEDLRKMWIEVRRGCLGVGVGKGSGSGEVWRDRDVRYAVRLEQRLVSLWGNFEQEWRNRACELIRKRVVVDSAMLALPMEQQQQQQQRQVDEEEEEGEKPVPVVVRRKENTLGVWDSEQDGNCECLSETSVWRRYQNQSYNPYSGIIFFDSNQKQEQEESSSSQSSMKKIGFLDHWKASVMELFELVKDERSEKKKSEGGGSVGARSDSASSLGVIEECLYESIFAVGRKVLDEIRDRSSREGLEQSILLAIAQHSAAITNFFEDLLNELHVQSRNEISTLGRVASGIALRAAWSRSGRSDAVLSEFFQLQQDFESTFLKCHQPWIESACRSVVTVLQEQINASFADLSGVEKLRSQVRQSVLTREKCWSQFFIELSEEYVRLPTMPSDFVVSTCIYGLNRRVWRHRFKEDHHRLLILPLVTALRNSIDSFYLEYVREFHEAMEGLNRTPPTIDDDGMETTSSTLSSSLDSKEAIHMQLLFDVCHLHEVFKRSLSGTLSSRRRSAPSDDEHQSKVLELLILSKIDGINWEVYEAQFRKNVEDSVTRTSLVCGFLCCDADASSRRKRGSVVIPPDEKFVTMCDTADVLFTTLPIPDKMSLSATPPSSGSRSRTRRRARRRRRRKRPEKKGSDEQGFLQTPIGKFFKQLW